MKKIRVGTLFIVIVSALAGMVMSYLILHKSDKGIMSNNIKTMINTEPYIDIQDTCMLRIYSPKYSKIDLVCGQIPKNCEDSVIMVCAGAYTVKCLDQFNHLNIIGNHVSGGKFYNGTPSTTYRGGFSYYNGKPHFSYNSWYDDFKKAASNGGCGFAQDMMIHKGKIVEHYRNDESKNKFRALCLINNKLAVVDSKESITFRTFISLLKEIGVTEAIYLDMGDWKYSWYRNEVGDSVYIYPSTTKFGTNWITIPKLYDERRLNTATDAAYLNYTCNLLNILLLKC